MQAPGEFGGLAVIGRVHKEKRGFPLFYPQAETVDPGREIARVDGIVDVPDEAHQRAVSRGKHV